MRVSFYFFGVFFGLFMLLQDVVKFWEGVLKNLMEGKKIDVYWCWFWQDVL